MSVVVNRAFHAAARVLIGAVGTQEDDLAAVVTWALRQGALRRLAELGLEEDQAEGLLNGTGSRRPLVGRLSSAAAGPP